jgi:hypothetical protein
MMPLYFDEQNPLPPLKPKEQAFIDQLPSLINATFLSLPEFNDRYVQPIIESLIEQGLFGLFGEDYNTWYDPETLSLTDDEERIETFRQRWFQAFRQMRSSESSPPLLNANLAKALDYWWWYIVIDSEGSTLQDNILQILLTNLDIYAEEQEHPSKRAKKGGKRSPVSSGFLERLRQRRRAISSGFLESKSRKRRDFLSFGFRERMGSRKRRRRFAMK